MGLDANKEGLGLHQAAIPRNHERYYHAITIDRQGMFENFISHTVRATKYPTYWGRTSSGNLKGEVGHAPNPWPGSALAYSLYPSSLPPGKC